MDPGFGKRGCGSSNLYCRDGCILLALPCPPNSFTPTSGVGRPDWGSLWELLKIPKAGKTPPTPPSLELHYLSPHPAPPATAVFAVSGVGKASESLLPTSAWLGGWGENGTYRQGAKLSWESDRTVAVVMGKGGGFCHLTSPPGSRPGEGGLHPLPLLLLLLSVPAEPNTHAARL